MIVGSLSLLLLLVFPEEIRLEKKELQSKDLKTVILRFIMACGREIDSELRN